MFNLKPSGFLMAAEASSPGERSYRSTKPDGASFFGKEETALTAAMKCESASELATSWSVGRSA